MAQRIPSAHGIIDMLLPQQLQALDVCVCKFWLWFEYKLHQANVQDAPLRTITDVRMSVPCCYAITKAVTSHTSYCSHGCLTRSSATSLVATGT